MCAICQVNRHDVRFAGLVTTVSEEETDCSIWYRENIEPRHAHVWVRGTWSESYNAFGVRLYGSNISGRAGGPIVRFGSGEVMLMYQRCPDPERARSAFLRLSKWEADSTKGREEQLDIELKLARWADSGLVEPWPLGDP